MKLTQNQPTFQDVFSTAFMAEHTGFPTIGALFAALGHSLHGGHGIIRHWELDFFIRMKTPFASWNDMKQCAELCCAG